MATSKKAGKKSLAQNDFLAPKAPGLVVANDVGTNRAFDNAAAVISFTTNAESVSYTVTSSSPTDLVVKTATGTDSPIIFEGLKSNTQYTFTVAGTGANGLQSSVSDPSSPITVTTVPQAVQAVVATSPAAGQDHVEWNAPLNGGKAITNYFWTSVEVSPLNPTRTGNLGSTAFDTTYDAAEMGTTQYYLVYADNTNGRSLVSPQSNQITTTFSFAPFNAFGFSPFQAFGFAPFGAFAFSPFKAFAFSPFKAFAFSPFKAFTFTPFGAFGFSPFRAFRFTPVFSR